MTALRGSLPILLCLIGLVIVSGCSGKTSTGRSYTFTVDRNVQVYMAASLEKTHATAERVLREDLGYRIESSRVDALEGLIEAKTARDNTVRVETFKDGENTTRVRVFSGPMGDRSRSVTITERIERGLR